MSVAAVNTGVLAALPLCADPVELDEINLDYAATTPALVAVVDAVQQAIPYGSLHRGGGRKSAVSTTLFEEARASVARFVGCTDADSVVFVRNTTEAANLLAVALPIGTRVLCSPFEHHANRLPWRQHRVTHLPFTTTAADFLEAVVHSLEAADRAGDPFSLVAITGASNVTGEMPPVTDVARLAHDRGALVFARRRAAGAPPSDRPPRRSEPTSLRSPGTRSTPRSAPARSSPPRRVSLARVAAPSRPAARCALVTARRCCLGFRLRAGSRPARRTSSGP